MLLVTNKATNGSAAPAFIPWKAVIDDVVLRIWESCRPLDVITFGRTAPRFYKLLVERKIGDLFWVNLVRKSFPDLQEKYLKFSGLKFYKECAFVWDRCREHNLQKRPSAQWVEKCPSLPCAKMPESVLLDNDGRHLVLCSKDLKVHRYGFGKQALEKIGGSHPAFDAVEGPTCMDRRGEYLATVGSDPDFGTCVVNLSHIETGSVEKLFVGKKNPHIKAFCSSGISAALSWVNSLVNKAELSIHRLCVTEKYVIALAKADRDNASEGCVLIWDRTEPKKHKIPICQLELDRMIDIQVKGNRLCCLQQGRVPRNPKTIRSTDLFFLDLNKLANWNGVDQKGFIKTHADAHLFYFKENNDDFIIKSFAVESSTLFIHCLANSVSCLRMTDFSGGPVEIRNLETTSAFSRIQQGTSFLAAFLEKKNSVEFFDFSPARSEFQFEAEKEFSAVNNSLRLLSKQGLSQEQCFQYFDHWLLSLHKVGIVFWNDLERILELKPPKPIPHHPNLLRAAWFIVEGADRHLRVWERSNFWERNKKCLLIANPWDAIREKLGPLSSDLVNYYKNEKETRNDELGFKLLNRVNSFIDEFNLANKIEIFQMYICNPDRIHWWKKWVDSEKLSSLSSKEGTPNFQNAFLNIFGKLAQ